MCCISEINPHTFRQAHTQQVITDAHQKTKQIARALFFILGLIASFALFSPANSIIAVYAVFVISALMSPIPTTPSTYSFSDYYSYPVYSSYDDYDYSSFGDFSYVGCHSSWDESPGTYRIRVGSRY